MAPSTDIADYHTFVHDEAGSGHTDIQEHEDQFWVLHSTGTVAARYNT